LYIPFGKTEADRFQKDEDLRGGVDPEKGPRAGKLSAAGSKKERVAQKRGKSRGGEIRGGF